MFLSSRMQVQKQMYKFHRALNKKDIKILSFQRIAFDDYCKLTNVVIKASIKVIDKGKDGKIDASRAIKIALAY